MSRKQYKREYRKAIYSLVKAGKIEWCHKFLEATINNNIDKYESKDNTRWPDPQVIRRHIGLCDEKEILQSLYDSHSSIESIVYVYFNSFLRGIASFASFFSFMYKKYEGDLISEIQKYKIGGRVSIDKEKGIFYFNANTVKKGKHKFFLTRESATVLSRLEIEENISWFSCKLMSYNPNSEVYKFSVLGFGQQRLDNIISRLQVFEEDGIVSNEFVEALNMTNISLVGFNSSEFVELCIRVLGAIVSCCNDRDKLYETVRGLERINYYSYNPKRNSGNERNLKGITPNQFREIRSYWNKLYQSSLDVLDCFMIYRNTILRRMYGFSEFVERFIENSDDLQSEFFLNIGEFAGRVQVFANSEETPDNMVLFVAPAEFKMTNKARENTTRKYDRYLMEIPLYGESVTSVRKQNSIQKWMPVRFEIDRYDGEGLFLIKNIRFGQ